ncbi:hypothetical protein Alches_16630 [Alicyclobacillus hesperidum subsp. aegles]|nr:hypothetical protein Alches_16630 [Alicyclobacillus hesperidum subsp. aegles]
MMKVDRSSINGYPPRLIRQQSWNEKWASFVSWDGENSVKKCLTALLGLLVIALTGCAQGGLRQPTASQQTWVTIPTNHGATTSTKLLYNPYTQKFVLYNLTS